MMQKIKNITNRFNKLFSQLAAERKKAVLALSLVCVMAFMWVRVIAKKAPAAAKATSTTQQANIENSSDSRLKITYIELPEVSGRNDTITRDFFTSNGWKNFLREGRNQSDFEEVNIVSTDGNEEIITQVARKLKLEAIIFSKDPQAFINDKLLSVGDKLHVKDGANMYECEVVKISENTVLIKSGQGQITLKLIKTIEVAD